MPPRAYAELPLVLGEGAGPAAAGVINAIREHKALAKLPIDAIERVGDRRWSLHLAGGTIVHLPGLDDPGAEVERFAKLPNRAALLARDPRVIDLRLDDRVTVRLKSGDALARQRQFMTGAGVSQKLRPVPRAGTRTHRTVSSGDRGGGA